MTKAEAASAKRHVMTMRMTQEMRELVEASAAATGRSLSQEIELRLERSFRQDERRGDTKQAEFIRTVEHMMDTLSTIMDSPCIDDPDAFELFRRELNYLMSLYRPDDNGENAFELPAEYEDAMAAYAEAYAQYSDRLFADSRRIAELAAKEQKRTLTEEEKSELTALMDRSPSEPNEPKMPLEVIIRWRTAQWRASALRRAAGAMTNFGRATFERVKLG